MSNIVWIISTILILNFISIIFSSIQNKKQSKSFDGNIMRPNKICFIVGLCGMILFLIAIVLAWFLDKTTTMSYKILYSCLMFLFTIGVYGYLIFFYLNYKIIVFEDYFIYQNFWRVKKKFYYKDIEINKTKIYPQVRKKLDNGKTKLIFKLAGVLDNEEAFVNAYKNWKNKPKSK